MDNDGIGDACDPDQDGDGFTVDQDCDDTDPSIYFNAPELCDGLDNDCDGQIDEVCTSCDPANVTTNMDVVEIDFGTANARVNATWNNPNGTTSCQVRGGRISPSSSGTPNPQFANINNTQVISQTNGSTINFNIALFNNPTIPFAIGKTYGFEVRCLCEDGSEFTNWSGIIPQATFVVPALPPNLPLTAALETKAHETISLLVFPNPSNGRELNITVEAGDLGNAFVRILDMNGRLIDN